MEKFCPRSQCSKMNSPIKSFSLRKSWVACFMAEDSRSPSRYQRIAASTMRERKPLWTSGSASFFQIRIARSADKWLGEINVQKATQKTGVTSVAQFGTIVTGENGRKMRFNIYLFLVEFADRNEVGTREVLEFGNVESSALRLTSVIQLSNLPVAPKVTPSLAIRNLVLTLRQSPRPICLPYPTSKTSILSASTSLTRPLLSKPTISPARTFLIRQLKLQVHLQNLRAALLLSKLLLLAIFIPSKIIK